eukprot:35823-Amphidinium_carterae.1
MTAQETTGGDLESSSLAGGLMMPVLSSAFAGPGLWQSDGDTLRQECIHRKKSDKGTQKQ